MHYFPVFMDLRQQKVLVIGGGAVAERKIRLLLKAGADVRVVARSLSDNVQSWKDQEKVRHFASDWNPSQLEGVRLVYAATDDDELNRAVHQAAEQANVPVNVVDEQELCRFISPAIVDRSPILVAISTAGTAPVLARKIRSWIERLLPAHLGTIATAAGRVRTLMKRKLPMEQRRVFWERLLTDNRLTSWTHRSETDIREEMASAILKADIRPEPGKVILVGAGPGRPDLLTIRALDALGRADVILHDRLVPEEILDLSRRDADRIYVGKQAGNHHCTQQQIHQIMLKHARQGKTVVRLKGGDPFIFGRGGEELEVLRKAGIEYEVVPGVTAALGCAAWAGIPLTHRDLSRSVTFVTGHLAAKPDQQAPDWAGIAGPDKTTVVYMGVGQAGKLRQQLMEAGISGALPVALVVNGTRADQRTVQGTVATLPVMAQSVAGGDPALLIIGQVAGLGSNLGWITEQSELPTAA